MGIADCSPNKAPNKPKSIENAILRMCDLQSFCATSDSDGPAMPAILTLKTQIHEISADRVNKAVLHCGGTVLCGIQTDPVVNGIRVHVVKRS